MSSEKGWIKLHRDILGHWVYEDPLLLKLWITLLCKANHEEKKITINKDTLVIHRGQFWTSIRKISVLTDMTQKTTSKKLSQLQNDGMIFLEIREGVGTLITINNYGQYQDFSAGSGSTQDRTNDRTNDRTGGAHRTALSTNKQEDKNDKALFKNVKNNGLPPDDPDYFEEV